MKEEPGFLIRQTGSALALLAALAAHLTDGGARSMWFCVLWVALALYGAGLFAWAFHRLEPPPDGGPPDEPLDGLLSAPTDGADETEGQPYRYGPVVKEGGTRKGKGRARR